MTFSRCRIYPSLFLFLFLLALAVIPASARDLSQQKQESASSQPVQNNEDPLKRPLKAHEHKSLQGKEGKHCRDWEKDVRVIMTDEALSAFRKIKENAEQVGAGDGRLTLGKRLALAELEAGEYQLTVKVTDLILGQTIPQRPDLQLSSRFRPECRFCGENNSIPAGFAGCKRAGIREY